MADEQTNLDPNAEDPVPEEAQTSQPQPEAGPQDAGDTPEATAADVAPEGAETPAPEPSPESEEVAAVGAEAEGPDQPAAEKAVAEPGGGASSAADEASAADGNAISQAELDALAGELGQAGGASASPTEESAPKAGGVNQAELDALVSEISQSPEAVPEQPPPDSTPVEASAANTEGRAPPAVLGAVRVATSAEDASEFASPELGGEAGAGLAGIDLLDDVQLDVKIELGRTSMYVEDVLRLGAGAVVELDKLAGDPVDIYVNDRLIARGEVLVLNDNFCVRINDIHSPIPELAND